MDFQEFKTKYFPLNMTLLDNDINEISRCFKKNGEEAAVQKLSTKSFYDKSKIFNFRPPVKCSIIAMSRPFNEWDISKASTAIQTYIYDLTKENFEKCQPGTSKDSHTKWLKETNLDIGNYQLVIGLNKIFPNALNTYQGVIDKTKNKNDKKKKDIEKDNKERVKKGKELLIFKEEKAFGEDGKLLQKPGLNYNIYCYQSCSPSVCYSAKDFNNIPKEYIGYYRKKNKLIISPIRDRLDIPQGEPGYVPEHQRPSLSQKKNRRRRMWYSDHNLKPKKNRKATKYTSEQIAEAKAKDALLCLITIGEKDWVLFDARALLRGVYYRNLAKPGELTLEKLLAMFSGDPVIEPKRNQVVFCYKEGIVPVHSENITTTKQAPDLLKKLAEKEPIGLISIDLGATNPLASKFSKISLKDNELKSEFISRQFLSETFLNEIKSYREKLDQIIIDAREVAIKSLTPEQQKEIENAAIENMPDKVMSRANVKYGIDISKPPLDKMSDRTKYIAKAYLEIAGSDPELVFDKYTKRNLSDFDIYYESKIKLSKETNQALSKATWDMQKASPEYKKLSKRQKQTCRSIVNSLIREGKEKIGCSTVVLAIEDLKNIKMKKRGSGKRVPGWNNFNLYKRENRWWLSMLHTTLSELPEHRGINVILAFAARTSITCKNCNHCDKRNRNGELFKCVECNYEASADLDIATDHIERVALTGKAMPKPASERSTGKKKTETARKAKKRNDNKTVATEQELTDALSKIVPSEETEVTRKSDANAA